MTETTYQSRLIKKLQKMFPGCLVLKNNPLHLQGIPDLLVLYKQFWAALEVKISPDAPVQPNQEYWIEHLNNHSFAAFVYPENEREVLDALQVTFGSSG